MRPARTTLIAAALAVSACLLPAATAQAATAGPTTSGIIVWTDSTGAGDHLMIARADGSHVRSLTPLVPDEFDIDAEISPDGRWVVFEHDTPQAPEIWLVRTDGTGLHRAPLPCTDPCLGLSGGPSWLSDDRISYDVLNGPVDANGNLASVVTYTARIDGTHVRRFTPVSAEGRFEVDHLRVSQDRSYVTFRRIDVATGAGALFRADPDGRDPQQLTPDAIQAEVYDLSSARRGPTKDLLVFESFGRGDPDATFVDIATVPATCGSLADCTAKIVWLTDNGASGRRNANPNWSPDGSSIVFTDRASIDIRDAEIWTMRYLGTQRLKISNSPDFDFRPAWGVRRG